MMTYPLKPVRSKNRAHLGWTGVCALASVIAAYAGWLGVQSLEIPTARDWVARAPALATANVLPVLDMDFAALPVQEKAADKAPIQVPRVLVQDVPKALTEIEDVRTRKQVFVRTVLPLVLEVNRLIRRDRSRLLDLKERMAANRSIAPADQRWLKALANEYELEEVDIDALLLRVDTVPPSLALAQAANESAWGRSRFARNGNALFGQWTWDGKGIVPEKRAEGKTHRVRAFETPLASVYAYMNNLNTHPSYTRFRQLRAQLKAKDSERKGLALAGTLLRYSERREAYVSELKAMIRSNDFYRFNDTVLVEPPDVFAFAPKIDEFSRPEG